MADSKVSLEGWEEIAAYLKRSVRSVQRWETTRGLPVHRRTSVKNSKRRGEVYALTHELDQWLRGREDSPVPENEKKDYRAEAYKTATPGIYPRAEVYPCGALAVHPPRNGRFPWTIGAWAVAAIFVILLAVLLLLRQPDPATVSVEHGSIMVAWDASGSLLWRRHIKSTIRPEYGSGLQPQIVDLAGDGSPVVVFGFKTDSTMGDHEDRVVCFNRKGNEIWSFRPGGPTNIGDPNFPDNFPIAGVSAGGRLANGKRFVAVIANHRFDSTSKITLLNAKGEAIYGLWHNGWVFDHLVLDLGDDGLDELLLVGVNDSKRKAFLAVVDPGDFRKARSAEADSAHRLLEKEALAYCLIPQSEVATVLRRSSRAISIRANWPERVLVLEVEMASGPDVPEIVYHLDRNFRPIRLHFSDKLVNMGKKLVETGHIPEGWERRDAERLGQFEFARRVELNKESSHTER